MSKFIDELNLYKAAFDALGFDAAVLAENPEALEEFINEKASAGLEDLKARISHLENENAGLKESILDLSENGGIDDDAALELLEEAQAELETVKSDLAAEKSVSAALQESANALTAGLANAGINIEGIGLQPEKVQAAIETRQKVYASELLASHGVEVLEDSENLDADTLNKDPFAGLTGLQRAAAALKARSA